jgi:hypothetical protein
VLYAGDVVKLTPEYVRKFAFWDFRDDTFEIVGLARPYNDKTHVKVKVLTQEYGGRPSVPLEALELVHTRKLVELEDLL